MIPYLKDVLIWVSIIAANLLAIVLLKFPLAKMVVPFWFFALPFLGFWFFGSRYKNMSTVESSSLGLVYTLAGLVIWVSLIVLLISLHSLTLSGEALASLPQVDNSMVLALWYLLLPMIFTLPLGNQLLRNARVWTKPWSYISAIIAILLSIGVYVYASLYHGGKLSIDYVPFLTYTFLVLLLALYCTGLAKVPLWASLMVLAAVSIVGVYFSFEIFFSGFFYHGFAASLVFMLYISIRSSARTILQLIRT